MWWCGATGPRKGTPVQWAMGEMSDVCLYDVEAVFACPSRPGPAMKGAPVLVTDCVIVFLTDGQDSTYGAKAGGAQTMTQLLRTALEPWVRMGMRVVVHTVGFSADHDYKVCPPPHTHTLTGCAYPALIVEAHGVA